MPDFLESGIFIFSGAGGDRTRVQTRNEGAFYMLILSLIVGLKSGDKHPNSNRISLNFAFVSEPHSSYFGIFCHPLTEAEPNGPIEGCLVLST